MASAEVSRQPVSAASRSEGVRLIDFEQWPTRPRGDISIVAPEARVVGTTIGTGDAHSGEWYLEIEGANRLYQRSVALRNVRVRPNMTYDLSFFLRSTEHLRPNRTVLLDIRQLTRDGTPLQGLSELPALAPLPAAAWTPYERTIVTGPATEQVSVTFRFDNILPGSKLFLDDIALRPGQANVFLSWEIDPETALLTGRAVPSGDLVDAVERVTVLVLREGSVLTTREVAPEDGHFALDLHGFRDGVAHYLTAVAELRDGRCVFSVNADLSDVRAGRREVKTAFRGRDVTVHLTDKYNLSTTYVRPESRVWEHNTLGLLADDEAPPAPWTPVEFEAATGTVQTWNNTFVPGDGLSTLDIRYRDSGQAMTSAPIALSLDGAGLGEAFVLSKTQAVEVSPHQVRLTSSGARSALRVELETLIDFCGFVRTCLRFLPVAGARGRIERLTLNLPFAPGFARSAFCRGVISEPSYTRKTFHPYFWAGNHETGLQWCTDRLYPGTRDQRTAWLSMTPGRDETRTLVIHLVNEPTPVPASGLTVRFGLMPCPARPFSPALRNIRMRSGPDATHDMIAGSLHAAFKHYGWPELTSRAEFEQFLRRREAPRAVPVFYLAAGYAMETVPQVTYFKKRWLNCSGHSYKSGTPVYVEYATGDTTMADMGEQSWLDLVIWQFRRLLDQAPEIKGIYNDTNYPTVEEEDGLVHCPVFAGYEYHKRLHVLLQRRRGAEAVTMYHHDLDPLLPYTAFADYLLVGEGVRMQLLEHTYYLDFLTLPEFRMLFRAPIGGMPLLLPQYLQPQKANDPALQAHLVGLATLHGLGVWQRKHAHARMAMRELFDFGDLSTAIWYPYWKGNPYIVTGNDAVLCSCYERNGELFAVLFNSTRDAQQACVRVTDALRRAGAVRLRVYDPVAGRAEESALARESIALEFGPYLPYLLTVRRK